MPRSEEGCSESNGSYSVKLIENISGMMNEQCLKFLKQSTVLASGHKFFENDKPKLFIINYS